MKDETLVGQISRALFAVEAVVMPVIFFVSYHIRAFTKASDGILASSTLLGHKVLVAFHVIILLTHRGEPLPIQLLRAGNTYKALSMLGLILVTDSSWCDGFVVFHTVLGKLGLMANHTVELIVFREETLGCCRWSSSYARWCPCTPHSGLLPQHAVGTLCIWGRPPKWHSCCTGSCCPRPQRSHWPSAEGTCHHRSRCCASRGSYTSLESALTSSWHCSQVLAHCLSKHARQQL